MSKRVGRVSIIVPEEDRTCQMCGKVAECRPYGHNGQDICGECAETIPEIVNHNLSIVLFGESGQLK